MSSDVSHCLSCGRFIPKGEAYCRECWEYELKLRRGEKGNPCEPEKRK